MFLTLALVVLGAAIAVFFSQEFYGMFKKLFAIKGVNLFLPLFIATWLVYSFDYSTLWVVYYYRELLEGIVELLVNIMPFQEFAEPIALVIVLFTISMLPVFLIDLFVRKRTFQQGYQYPYLTSMFLFIVSAILLLAL